MKRASSVPACHASRYLQPVDEQSPVPLIFLSHSGRDAPRANELAARLTTMLAEGGVVAKVFCTSKPEDRFDEPIASVKRDDEPKKRREKRAARSAKRAETRNGNDQYRTDLIAYLSAHMLESSAFLSLITTPGFATSEYIRLELETAVQLGSERRGKDLVPFYYPLTTADTDGHFGGFPGLDESAEFQALNVDDAPSLLKLVDVLCMRLADGPTTEQSS